MVLNNNLPPNWSLVKLGDVIDKVSTTGIKLKQKEYLQEGQFPVVDQGQSLIGGYTNNKNMVVDCALPVIIFGDHTKVKKYINFRFVAGADGVIIIKPHKTWNPKLFYYFLHCIKFPDKGYARHFQYVEKANIPLPPLPEQKKIVEKIEELFSGLDSGIAELKKVKGQIIVYRQAVLASAFSGRLCRNLINQIPTKENDYKNILKAAEPAVEYGNGNLPAGWKWIKLNDVCEKIVGGGTPSTKVEKYWKGNIDWITSADIYGLRDIRPRKKVTKEAIRNSAANLVPKGTIIVVTRVSLGRLAVADRKICFSQDSQGLILNKKMVDDNYVLWFLSSATQIFKYKNRGTTIKGVTKKQLADLEFILPPKAQQTQIIEEIEKRFSEADNLEKAVDEGLSKAESLRQSILKQAFEGKLV